MALVKATVSAKIKEKLSPQITVGDDAQLTKICDALADAIIDILKNQMIVTAPGGGGVAPVT